MPNRAKVKDLLRRLTGKGFNTSEEFVAWWEGEDGAYQKLRPEWLLEALESAALLDQAPR